MLEFRSVGKSFPGVRALHDFTLTIEPGTVRGLVGENGAGKSTLGKVLAGGYADYEGEMLFDASEWRYGYGGGVLWFSPFGPLQLVLGFPVDPRSFEDSPVFEFSVGGLGI